MEQSTPNGSSISWHHFLLVAAVAANLFWLHPSLKSSRPGERSAFERNPIGYQDVEARLWQDPMEAAAKAAKTNDGIHFATNLTARIKDLREKPASLVTVMAVMITGSPYMEGSEWRLRSRYSTLSALSQAGWVPEDREHIGFFQTSWPRDATNDSVSLGDGAELTVPYEWLTRDATNKLLLLWLQDEAFESRPLTRFAQLLNKLQCSSLTSPKVDVKLIGPWSTTTLRGMASQCTDSSDIRCDGTNLTAMLRNVNIYSSSATCSDLSLDGSRLAWRDDGIMPRAHLSGHFQKAFGITFQNVTCTDDQLARVLLEELDRRGVSTTNGDDRVVLLSEWDTEYGRLLPLTLEQVRSNRWAQYQCACRVRPFDRITYLRGVDGKIAERESTDEDAKATANSRKDNARDRVNDLDALARPEGRSQFDYLPRLVDRLKKSQYRDGSIKAIGILGSDVYDKLLLLQSLRGHFPNVIFFTTDLDARLFHPTELKSSRNLIIASSFGLELNSHRQFAIAPFRDSYQTAQFLACQLAVTGSVLTNALSPRLFEIGQAGAHDLSVSGSHEDSTIHPAKISVWTYIKHRWFAFIGTVLCSIALVALFGPKARQSLLAPSYALTACFNRRDLKPFANEWAWAYSLLSALGFIIAGVFTWWLIADTASEIGEPLTFTEGISVWPTTLIRLLTFYLAVIFIVRGWYNLRCNWDETLAEQFVVPIPGRTPEKRFVPMVKRLWRYRSAWKKAFSLQARANFGISSWNPTLSGAHVDAATLLDEYQRRARLKFRLARVFPTVIVYVALCIAWLTFFGFPFRPFRGSVSGVAEVVALVLSIASFITLLFFVVDATRLSAKLIDNLSQKPTDWGASFAKFERRRFVPREFLDEYMDVQFIAQRTKVVVRLIYFPFAVLFLMIVARNHYFDGYDWPISLLLIFGANAAYAIYCASCLRGAAERARAKSLQGLKDKLCSVMGGNAPNTGPKIEEQIKLMIAEVEQMEEGAFAGIAKHPVLGAVLMPFGGVGILALLDYLATH